MSHGHNVVGYPGRKSPNLGPNIIPRDLSGPSVDRLDEPVAGSRSLRYKLPGRRDESFQSMPRDVVYSRPMMVPLDNLNAEARPGMNWNGDISPSSSDCSGLGATGKSFNDSRRLYVPDQVQDSSQSCSRHQFNGNCGRQRHRDCPVTYISGVFPENNGTGNELCLWQPPLSNTRRRCNSCQSSKGCPADNRGSRFIMCRCRRRNLHESSPVFQKIKKKKLAEAPSQCKNSRASTVYLCECSGEKSKQNQAKTTMYLCDVPCQNSRDQAAKSTDDPCFIIGKAEDIGPPEDLYGQCKKHIHNTSSDDNSEEDGLEYQNTCLRALPYGSSDHLMGLDHTNSCTYSITKLGNFIWETISSIIRTIILCIMFKIALLLIMIYIPSNYLAHMSVLMLILLLLYILLIAPDHILIYSMFW